MNPFLFFISFTTSFIFTLYIVNTKTPVVTDEVLAQATEMPTPKPTVLKTPSPKPKVTTTPSPTPLQSFIPTPTPDVWSPPEMEPVFSRYAGQYGVDQNILERLANCESHFNPNARNGDYVGMFQFSTSTWINYRHKIGADPNSELRTNIEESIKTAAYLVSVRGTAPWPACLR